LVIGWRATEQHFLNVWKQVLVEVDKERALVGNPNISYLLIVDGSRENADLAHISLREAGLRPWRSQVYTDGFSAFLRDGRLLSDFLQAQ
jgi:hypothetical protein